MNLVDNARSSASSLDASPKAKALADAVRQVADRVVGDGPRAAVLEGRPLGHPAHPPLTDLPIGFWTSSCVLDVIGGRRSRTAARRLIGLGVATAIPTAAAGLADYRNNDKVQRIGAVHAATNAAATGLYAWSWWRRRRSWTSGVAIGMVAAAVATVGGYLGGHMAFGETSGPADGADHDSADSGPVESWTLGSASDATTVGYDSATSP